jgi:hypothetical protein
MSKMDDLRAMREARYQRSAVRPAQQPPPARSKPARPEPAVPQASDDVAEQEAALCGHRAISGRTCTREAGHAAKSHRYS